MNIKALRQKVGLTQLQLAEKVGCCAQQIHNIETGRVPVPLRHVSKLCEILCVSEKAMMQFIIDVKASKLIEKQRRYSNGKNLLA